MGFVISELESLLKFQSSLKGFSIFIQVLITRYNKSRDNTFTNIIKYFTCLSQCFMSVTRSTRNIRVLGK